MMYFTLKKPLNDLRSDSVSCNFMLYFYPLIILPVVTPIRVSFPSEGMVLVRRPC